MTKKLIRVQVLQEGEERVLLKTYDNGLRERTPIVSRTRKKPSKLRPYWYWDLASGRRKFF
jgi:hypothetical protein